MRSEEAKYLCDICGRITYTKKSVPPDGWHTLKFWTGEEPSGQDCCDSCSSAVVSTILKRKKAERGRHDERPLYDGAPTPDQANAIAKIRFNKSFSSSS